MKVIWICNIILPQIAKYLKWPEIHGGGWMVGALNKILNDDSIDITICFPCEIVNKKNNNIFNKLKNKISQNTKSSIIIEGKFKNVKFVGFKETNDTKDVLKKIFDEVKPDIIHIWGTEFRHSYDAVNAAIDLKIIKKVVVNLQGLKSIISKHFYASLPHKTLKGQTFFDFLANRSIYKLAKKFEMDGFYEKETLQKVHYCIGRTDWDEACSTQINPQIKYFFCNECLRETFYNKQWDYELCEKYSLLITQAHYPVKGLHYVLEALSFLIKKYPNIKLYISGSNIFVKDSLIKKINYQYYYKYLEKLVSKYNLETNIQFLGDLDEEQMCQQMLKSNIFVSSSTIENESNSLSEAKILGVPSIASFVGGVTNRIIHNFDGFLYQHDAPYMLAFYIDKIFSNPDLAKRISKEAKKNQTVINDVNINYKKLLEIYNYISVNH